MRGFISLAVALGLTLSGCSALRQSVSGKRDRYYEVQSGDTLDSIGTKFLVPPEEIQSYNAIKDPRQLRKGQRIVIPAVGPLDRDPPAQGSRSGGDSGLADKNRAQLRMVSLAPVRGYVGQLEFPVEQARYTSRFGWRWSKFHEGIDLSAPEGAAVLAAHDGVVVLESDSWGSFGKVVVLKGEGLLTVYAHNSANRVKKGSRVRRGQQIARVGATGNATAPHLHFEVRILDEQGRFAAVNPTVFFP
jgi:murein DD-endopeptidase MepM/ murein hydrolase activator NlpD